MRELWNYKDGEALAYARKRIKTLDAKCNFTAEEQRLLDEITEEMLSEEK